MQQAQLVQHGFSYAHESHELWLYDDCLVGTCASLLVTPISNFEVAMDDSYKEVSDPAITVMFDIIAGETGLEGRPVSE